jgi:hypothetical protein
MSQVIVSRNSLGYRRRRQSMASLNIKPFLMMVTIGMFISFLSVMMLVSFNKASTKGYTIKYLEVQQQGLWEENELLKKDLLQQKALSVLGESEKAKTMIKPGRITYVSGHTALAQKTD